MLDHVFRKVKAYERFSDFFMIENVFLENNKNNRYNFAVKNTLTRKNKLIHENGIFGGGAVLKNRKKGILERRRK